MTDCQRLDLWLYHARLARSRGLCAAFIAKGRIRLNGQRVTKPHARIRPGDVLTFPALYEDDTVHVWRVLRTGKRRGPAREAALLYTELPEGDNKTLATMPKPPHTIRGFFEPGPDGEPAR